MQPETSGTPLSLTAASVGMVVLDRDDEQVGVVSAVQEPGTQVRPDVAAGVAEELMAAGYLRIDGTGHLSNDAFAGGDQIRDIAPGDPGVVTLAVTWEEMFRTA